MINQKILPAISDMKALERFLDTDKEYCLLMNFHLIRLEDICALLKNKGKKCIIHIDLIRGLSSDEYGAEYLIQKLGVDGLISTRPQVIHYAKDKNKIAIQRVFLIDSLSLEKSIKLAKKTRPDYIEILPAIASSVVARIQEEIDIPLIGGGLIANKEELIVCLEAGLCAVTTSNKALW